MNNSLLGVQDNIYMNFMSSIFSLGHTLKGEVLTFLIILIFFLAKQENLKLL